MKGMFQKKAASSVEYMLVVIVLIATFLIFKQYFVRALGGYWKKAGDTFGHGRYYDPMATQRCYYDPFYTEQWYDAKCWEANCLDECHAETGATDACVACIQSCDLGCND